jgi:uncharacterized DUF497 family protein
MLEFEWDEEKNRRNKLKHGLDFSVAVWVFRDLFSHDQEDCSMHCGEMRRMVTGLVGGRLITLIYTERENRYRIVSARKASRGERYEYEENNR